MHTYFKRRNVSLMNGKLLSENFTYIDLYIHRPGYHGNIIAVWEILYCNTVYRNTVYNILKKTCA